MANFAGAAIDFSASRVGKLLLPYRTGFQAGSSGAARRSAGEVFVTHFKQFIVAGDGAAGDQIRLSAGA
jgi:hypothetical protein